MNDDQAEFDKLRDLVRSLFPPEKQRWHLGFVGALEHAHRVGGAVRVEVAEEVKNT